jgi:hypothetical protein
LKIGDLFGKRSQDEVMATKVLVASSDPKFAELAKTDCGCYSQFYPTPAETNFENIQELLKSIGSGFDIVHLFCDVSPEGNIIDRHGSGTAATILIERCCDSDAKLLWVASSNRPEGYIKGFNSAGKRLNLVLTIERNGPCFPSFLESLLRKMSAGETMPVAWVSIAPQTPSDPRIQDLPVCIFVAGRARAKLR